MAGKRTIEIDDFRVKTLKTSTQRGFSTARFDYQTVADFGKPKMGGAEVALPVPDVTCFSRCVGFMEPPYLWG